VRVCIFNTLDVKCADVEGTSDVYCRVFFDSKDAKETDTHYRCSNGKASFNYRLLFNVKHPRKEYLLNLQLYDRDFFKSNDIIGDALLDLRLLMEDAALSKRPLTLNEKYYNDYLKEASGCKMDFSHKDKDSFWLPVKSMNNETGNMEEGGKVRVRIDILPKDQ
jgi:C2 domain